MQALCCRVHVHFHRFEIELKESLRLALISQRNSRDKLVSTCNEQDSVIPCSQAPCAALMCSEHTQIGTNVEMTVRLPHATTVFEVALATRLIGGIREPALTAWQEPSDDQFDLCLMQIQFKCVNEMWD